MKLVSIFIFLIGFSFSSFSQVDDAQARKILEGVSQKAKSFKNMKYEFNYRMVDKAHKIDNTLLGSIIVQGEMYNLNFMGRNVISDGQTIWAHDAEAEEIQISKRDANNDPLSFLKLLTSFDKEYKAKLIKTEKVGAKEFYIIDLTPIKAKSYFKVRLKIDKAGSTVQQATIYEKDNVEYILTVVKLTTNLTLPANTFKFNPSAYPNADIIDNRK